MRKCWAPDGTMRFGLFWPYSRTPIPSEEVARRNPDVLDIDNHVRLARAAEEAGLDFGLIADGYAPASEENSRVGFQDPSTNAVLWAPQLFAATRHLGFVSTMHTAYLHPTLIARLGAHLDFLSGGRWGWNVVNGFREHEALLFGLENLDHDGGYDRSEEATTIIRSLWAGDSIDHTGNHYRVKGRIRRPLPAETPLLVSAASSARGRIYAARHCNYLFAAPNDARTIRELTAELESNAAAAGREPPRIIMLCDLFIRDEPGRAQEEYGALMESQDAEARKVWAQHLSRINPHGARADQITAFAGTPAEIAEQIVSLHRDSGLTGILFRPIIWQPEEISRLAGLFGLLEKAGVWVPPAARGHSW